MLVKRLAPSLVAMPWCEALSAAKVVGETAGASRFSSKTAFARWNGHGTRAGVQRERAAAAQLWGQPPSERSPAQHSYYPVAQCAAWAASAATTWLNEWPAVMARTEALRPVKPPVKKGKTANWITGRTRTAVWEAASPIHIMSGSTEEKTEHPTQKRGPLYDGYQQPPALWRPLVGSVRRIGYRPHCR